MHINNLFQAAYRDKTVLVTGHTGFKGAWLCEWLLMLGARVVGIALPPNTQPSLFEQLRLSERMAHHLQDIRDRDALASLVIETQPDYVFHLAAQPLVRHSYLEPVDTYATNVMGTVHLLDALKRLQSSYRKTGKYCASVFVTTDKCYANREWQYAYREEDPLGGYDPYSASKACAELAIASFRQSYFNPEQATDLPAVGIASARAGNVIGGGDWAEDRIVPDCIRHLQNGSAIPVRNPNATRPWQHVLEPLSGYLLLAAHQRSALKQKNKPELNNLCSAFNFGPALTSNRPVSALVQEVLKHWPGQWEDRSQVESPHEAQNLNLAWDKAYHQMKWQPAWPFVETIAQTVTWYQQCLAAQAYPQELVQRDIAAYISALSRHMIQ